MRIALLTDGIYPYVIGGMQKHSFYLAKYFALRKIEVDLYHTNKSTFDIDLLEVFTSEEKKFIRSYVIEFPPGNGLPGHYLRASYAYSEKIFESFRLHSENVDFIYAKGFAAWKLLEEKQKGYKSAPLGLNFHGYEMFQKAPSFRSKLEQLILFRPAVLFNVKHADFLFSYGGKITEILRNISAKPERIIEIPTGIEREWLFEYNNRAHSVLRFVFIGRFERRKGIQELNAVLKKIGKAYNFEFHFIGPIPLKEQLRSSKIIYHGSISEPALIREILQKSDVLVCPSHSEGMPNVIMEAMASGLAVIASDVGAVSKMVNEQNGILIPPGNKEALEKSILSMLSKNEIELTALKKHSVEITAQNFLWDRIIEQTEDEIKKRCSPGS